MKSLHPAKFLAPFLTAALIGGAASTFAQTPPAAATIEASTNDPGQMWKSMYGASHDERMQWWREARFGMFIHWGVYSVPAGVWKGEQSKHIGEWLMLDYKIPVEEYAALTQRFNPVKFDA